RYAIVSQSDIAEAIGRLEPRDGHSEETKETPTSNTTKRQRTQSQAFAAGAGRGNRTPTVLSGLRILRPLRLPISPSRLALILAQGCRTTTLLSKTLLS